MRRQANVLIYNKSLGRMQALVAANAGFNLKQGAEAVQAGQGDANGMVKTGARNDGGNLKTNADGTPETAPANAADKAGGIGISLSLGASSSQSKQQSSADSAKGSKVNAGGNVSITATGAGKDSDITVQGSNVQAGKATTLKADDQVNLLAAQNTTSESSSNQSKSGSIGVAMQLGAGGGGMGFTASASKASGQGAGNSTTYTNSQVAGNTVNIQSGGDTNLKGAVVRGDQVMAKVGNNPFGSGGNLNIESLQDKSQYKESSKSAGGSVMVGAGYSGSINLAQSKVNSDYLSVGEQSAIRAGDGGFQVNVQGKTELIGGQITSTQAAIDNNKNSYEAKQGTTTTDLQNSASYSANSVSVGIGAGTLPGKSASAGMSGVGVGSDKGSAQSTTTAGISGVAGNTAARTGDKSTSINPIFDKDKTQKEVAAQVAITSEFGKQASKFGGTEADKQRDALKAQAKQAQDSGNTEKAQALLAESAKWEEGGAYRVAMHTVIGGLSGGAAGAVGAGAASAAAPTLNELQSQLERGLQKAGLGDSASKVIAGLAGGTTAAAIGAAASGGSVAGGATAFNADMNNRQLHPSERQKAAELAQKSGGKYKQEQIEEQMRLMGNAATGAQPNTITVLTNTDEIVNSLKNDPSMPKTAQGPVVLEVPGQANSELQAWIINNTTQSIGLIPGQSPYTASNAGLNKPTTTNRPLYVPAKNNWSYMGANSAGVASGVQTENRTQAEIDKSLNDTTKAVILAPYAAGAAVTAPAAAAISAGVNLTAQIVKGEGISSTEVMTSTIMGPLGTAITEVKAVKDIVEAGGAAAIGVKAGIGAATNVTSDSGAKIIKGEDVTSGSVLKAGVSGAVGALSKSPVMQNATTEVVNTIIDAVNKTGNAK